MTRQQDSPIPDPGARRARVARLRALLRARRYVVDPEATARGLVAAVLRRRPRVG